MAGSDEQGSDSSSSTPEVEENPSGYADPDSLASMAPDGPIEGLVPNPLAPAAKMMQAQNKEQREQRQEALEDGDGFQFDADELRALRDEWHELSEQIAQLRRNFEKIGIGNICPADDDASKSQIKAVNEHAKVCADIHEQMYQYASEYTDRLDEALGKLQESDAAAQDSVRATSKDM